MELGAKIKLLRESQGMTLEELGNLVGVGKSTVRKWETGMIANMKRDKIAKLAAALNCTPAYLMGWENIDSVVEAQNEASEYQLMVEKYAKELIEKRLTEKQLKYLMKMADLIKEQGDE